MISSADRTALAQEKCSRHRVLNYFKIRKVPKLAMFYLHCRALLIHLISLAGYKIVIKTDFIAVYTVHLQTTGLS